MFNYSSGCKDLIFRLIVVLFYGASLLPPLAPILDSTPSLSRQLRIPVAWSATEATTRYKDSLCLTPFCLQSWFHESHNCMAALKPFFRVFAAATLDFGVVVFLIQREVEFFEEL